MTFILKVMHDAERPLSADNEHSLYADIVSVHFSRQPIQTASSDDPAGAPEWDGTAHLWVRESVKTGDVPGVVELKKHVLFHGMAYVMNENGRTVSSFSAVPTATASKAFPSALGDETKALHLAA